MEPTHTNKAGKKLRINVWQHDTMIGGSLGNGNFPSVYQGDVYTNNEIDGIPFIFGHLKAEDFAASFTPLPGHEAHHEECLKRCKELNG